MLKESQHTEALELYDTKRLREDVENDLALLNEFTTEAEKVRPEDDPKLRALVEELVQLAEQARQDSASDEAEVDNRRSSSSHTSGTPPSGFGTGWRG